MKLVVELIRNLCSLANSLDSGEKAELVMLLPCGHSVWWKGSAWSRSFAPDKPGETGGMCEEAKEQETASSSPSCGLEHNEEE